MSQNGSSTSSSTLFEPAAAVPNWCQAAAWEKFVDEPLDVIQEYTHHGVSSSAVVKPEKQQIPAVASALARHAAPSAGAVGNSRKPVASALADDAPKALLGKLGEKRVGEVSCQSTSLDSSLDSGKSRSNSRSSKSSSSSNSSSASDSDEPDTRPLPTPARNARPSDSEEEAPNSLERPRNFVTRHNGNIADDESFRHCHFECELGKRREERGNSGTQSGRLPEWSAFKQINPWHFLRALAVLASLWGAVSVWLHFSECAFGFVQLLDSALVFVSILVLSEVYIFICRMAMVSATYGTSAYGIMLLALALASPIFPTRVCDMV